LIVPKDEVSGDTPPRVGIGSSCGITDLPADGEL
jgi:hypothetical protein